MTGLSWQNMTRLLVEYDSLRIRGVRPFDFVILWG